MGKVMKRDNGAKKIIVVAVIAVLAIMWFSDFLPLKIAEIVASEYMSKQGGVQYELVASNYSPAHDCYFVYFENEEFSKKKHIGIYYRFFPFNVYYDSDYPG